VSTLGLQGVSDAAAQKEVSAAVGMLVYYAGWCDKYQQVFSCVNPVESSHFNFSFPEQQVLFQLLHHNSWVY